MIQLLNEADFLDGGQAAGARLLHLADAAGRLRCAITNYGARLVSCLVPSEGAYTDVALGYGTLAGYRQQPEDYMGAIVGRCANRIAGGRFSIDGRDYQAVQNEGANTLHGGPSGLHCQLWTVLESGSDSVTLGLVAPAGEDGFPGRLEVEVRYRVLDGGALAIRYRATTDRPTLVNLSNHAYWNLSGEGSATIEDHRLQLNAAAYTPVDARQIPTGAVLPVDGSPFDFRRPQPIGSRIGDSDVQLRYGKGYDLNWALDRGEGPAAVLSSPVSGIRLQLFSSAPGLQFYSGNNLDGSRTGKSGRPYERRSALALEPQAYPDAVHHPNFPDIVLRPGEVYGREDVYRFSQGVCQ